MSEENFGPDLTEFMEHKKITFRSSVNLHPEAINFVNV